MTKIHVTTTVNGDACEFVCDPRETLLDALRDHLGWQRAWAKAVNDELVLDLNLNLNLNPDLNPGSALERIRNSCSVNSSG